MTTPSISIPEPQPFDRLLSLEGRCAVVTGGSRGLGDLSAYGAAKPGLWSATQAMAKELAEHKILVNALTSGSTITRERLDKMKAGTFGFGDVPEDAPKTREKFAAMMKNPAAAATMLTTMMPLGRPCWPDEIAKAALFLASDMASYISGANLIVDGAQTLR